MSKDHKFTKISNWIMYCLGQILSRLPMIIMIFIAAVMLVALFMIFFLKS